MFGINKNRLLKNLEKMGANSCCYLHPDGDWLNGRCDCKFGTENDIVPSAFQERFSGCCEIRQVYSLISAMDETIFDLLCKRAGVDIYE